MKKYLCKVISAGLCLMLLLSAAGCKDNIPDEGTASGGEEKTTVSFVFNKDGVYNKVGPYHINADGEVYENTAALSAMYKYALGISDGAEKTVTPPVDSEPFSMSYLGTSEGVGVIKLPIDGKAVSMSYYSDSGAFLTDKGELYVTGPKLSFCMDESSIFEGLTPSEVNIEKVKNAFYLEPKKLDTSGISGEIVKIERTHEALTVLTDSGKVYIYGRFDGRNFGGEYDEEKASPKELAFPEKIIDFRVQYFCVAALSETGNVYRVGYDNNDFRKYKPEDKETVVKVCGNVKALGGTDTYLTKNGEVYGIGFSNFLPKEAYDSDMTEYLERGDYLWTLSYTRNLEKAEITVNDPLIFESDFILQKDGTYYGGDRGSEKTGNILTAEIKARFTSYAITRDGFYCEENGKILKVKNILTWETEEITPAF